MTRPTTSAPRPTSWPRRSHRAANAEAERIRTEADEFFRSRTDEAEARATALVSRSRAERAAAVLAEVETSAAEWRTRAEREVEDLVEAARQQGREMLDEAKATRERVLADLFRRRGLLQSQVDELRGGRDNLLDAYRVVKRTFLEATEALAQVEARAAERAAAPHDAGASDSASTDAAAEPARPMRPTAVGRARRRGRADRSESRRRRLALRPHPRRPGRHDRGRRPPRRRSPETGPEPEASSETGRVRDRDGAGRGRCGVDRRSRNPVEEAAAPSAGRRVARAARRCRRSAAGAGREARQACCARRSERTARRRSPSQGPADRRAGAHRRSPSCSRSGSP